MEESSVEYTINVVNKRKHKPTPHDFYCGRPSMLGNPYSHIPKGTLAKHVVATREEAIQKYFVHFTEMNIFNIEFGNEVRKIADHLKEYKIVNLVCWCAPQSCHCDVIKNHLLKSVL